MKITILLFFIVNVISNAQGVTIGSNNPPDSSAILELQDTTKGFLLTRLTTAQRNAIPSPAPGLQIYNTTTKCIQVYMQQSGWLNIVCDCPNPPSSAFTFNGFFVINTNIIFNATASGMTYAWTFQSGNPSTSTQQTDTVTWSNAGTYTVSLTVTDNIGCSNTTTDTIMVLQTPPVNCLAILNANPNAQSGTYLIDPDGQGSISPFTCYCDMATDGGGWTLVMHDNQDNIILTNNISSQGNLVDLQSPTGGSAKYSDAVINALLSYNDNRIGYRISSNNINNRYFIPCDCAYQHYTNNNGSDVPIECRQFVSSYTPILNPSYLQCDNWGGGNAGIDLWYGCGNVNGNYTNVANTHKSSSYNEQSGITTNSTGAPLGSSNTSYGNDVLLWVR